MPNLRETRTLFQNKQKKLIRGTTLPNFKISMLKIIKIWDIFLLQKICFKQNA